MKQAFQLNRHVLTRCLSTAVRSGSTCAISYIQMRLHKEKDADGKSRVRARRGEGACIVHGDGRRGQKRVRCVMSTSGVSQCPWTTLIGAATALLDERRAGSCGGPRLPVLTQPAIGIDAQ